MNYKTIEVIKPLGKIFLLINQVNGFKVFTKPYGEHQSENSPEARGLLYRGDLYNLDCEFALKPDSNEFEIRVWETGGNSIRIAKEDDSDYYRFNATYFQGKEPTLAAKKKFYENIKDRVNKYFNDFPLELRAAWKELDKDQSHAQINKLMNERNELKEKIEDITVNIVNLKSEYNKKFGEIHIFKK